MMAALAQSLAACSDPMPPRLPACEAGAAGCPCLFSDRDAACDDGLTCREGFCFGGDVPAPDEYLYTDAAAGDGEQVNALLTATIDLAPGMVVADIGAGHGFYTLQAARRVYPGGRVYATDIAPDALENIRVSIEAAPDRDILAETVALRLVQGAGATGLEDLPGGSLDLITMFRVFTFGQENLAADVEFLRSLQRTLRPGGRLAYHIDVVQAPGYREYLTILMRLAGFTGAVTEIPMPAHIPAELMHYQWDCVNAREPMIQMYRGVILIFRKGGSNLTA
jgi:SAM-dependent methyltransferase